MTGIVEYLPEHGTIPGERLYEAPYTDYRPLGVEGVFAEDERAELIDLLQEIRQRAVRRWSCRRWAPALHFAAADTHQCRSGKSQLPMPKPFSIRIFMPSGDPDGLRLIEKSNWSGVGLVAPRPLFSEAKSRKELARTGVYVLVGPAEDSGLPRIYIGEGDPIRPRLEKHASQKDFWTSCIGFTSKDENLNKAHAQYLEARLIALANSAKRCALDNGNTPALPSMSESDAADAEGFLHEMLLCLPVLGISAFAIPAASTTTRSVLMLESKQIKASGYPSSDGFVVLAGSSATAHEQPSCHAYQRALRATLLKNGVLHPKGGLLEFTQEFEFSSPSTAAGVILGRPANGRTEWKTPEGKTLKSLQLDAGGV